jgi:hypothetical protein
MLQPHGITKFSPYYLLHGREISGPNDKMLEAYIQSKSKQSNSQKAVKEQEH